MRSLIDYFVNRPLIVNLISVLIIIWGLLAMVGTQKEIFPAVEFDTIIVTTQYPGSSSEDVEKLVTISIERALKEVDGIDELNSVSLEGSSVVNIKVDADENVDEVLDDVRNAIDTVDDLPTDAETPKVRKINNKARPVIDVAVFSNDLERTQTGAKNLRDRLERIPGVSSANLDGYRIDQIKIEVDPEQLDFYELTFGEVASAIKDRNINLSAGTIEAPGKEYFVRTVAEFESVEDIEEVIVRSNNSGQRVKVKDIATVTRAPDKDSVLQRVEGKISVLLNVKIREKADILKTTTKIKEATKEFIESNKGQGLDYSFINDLSYYVKRRLNILKDNGLLGMGLVFVCLMLFLNFRTSMITSLGAPLSFFVAFILMNAFGLSINLISMFGLILVLGMLVDDAIIVAEQFYQKLEKGMEPKQAAKEAAFETIKPVTATVLTTMIAFGSLLFMGGIMGKFLWQVPVIVILCLSASLAECFFILPSHLADFGRLSKRGEGDRWYKKIVSGYGLFLRPFLKYPFIVCLLFFVLLGGTALLAKKMKFELFPGDDVRVVFIRGKGPVGTPLEETDEKIRKLEQIVASNIRQEELETFKSYIGKDFGVHQQKTGSHYGSIVLYLTPPDERERPTDEIVQSLNDSIKPAFTEFEFVLEKRQGGPPKGKPIDLQITGERLDDLKKLSVLVRDKLKTIDGVVSTEIDFEDGKEQFAATIDEQEARRLGLTVTQVALELRRALAGDPITEIRESDEDIEIKLQLNEEARASLDALKGLYILNGQGNRIPLSRVVQYKTEPGAFAIRRLDRKRVISVAGNLDKMKTTPIKVGKEIRPELDKLTSSFLGTEITIGGENEDTQDSMFRLARAGGGAFLLIFFVLVVMFSSLSQPVIIMTAIPLGLVGVVFTFMIAGKALGFMALMGVVGLVGVVVNDSIVLVNFTNKTLARKEEEILSADDGRETVTQREMEHCLREAAIEAAMSRFRPVILTTFTTVAGLLPIAHAAGGDPFLKPMALSFAYGLLFSSLVTLVFVPCCYVFVTKNVWWLKALWNSLTISRKEVEELEEYMEEHPDPEFIDGSDSAGK